MNVLNNTGHKTDLCETVSTTYCLLKQTFLDIWEHEKSEILSSPPQTSVMQAIKCPSFLSSVHLIAFKLHWHETQDKKYLNYFYVIY